LNLVIEYSFSTQVKDTSIKRDLYAEAGIADYIVIDLKSFQVIHYSYPINGIYTYQQTYRSGLIQVRQIQVDVQRLL
jgi:Uma2 family endonuclease